MKKEMISCLECKYGKQIGEKVFYCCKHERNVMLQICTRIKKIFRKEKIVSELYDH